MIDREKVIEGLGLIREFLWQGLPGQRQVFETYINVLNDAECLLKKDEERFKRLESTNVTATGNGTAIGVVQGDLVIKKSTKAVKRE